MNPKRPPGTARRSGKKPYATPILATYGKLNELTLSGPTRAPEDNCGVTNLRDRRGDRNCSERHTKENIERVGTHPLGFGLYRFEYREAWRDQWGHGRQFGVMVDEVEPIVPEAISMHPDGYKLVDYALLGIDPTQH